MASFCEDWQLTIAGPGRADIALDQKYPRDPAHPARTFSEVAWTLPL
jgi:hypothetical protein